MNKTISAIIGIIFAIVQAFLPLTEEGISIKHRLLSASTFALIWIIYTVFAEKIEVFICRSVLGRSLHKKDSNEKIEHFHNRIVPLVYSIQKAHIQNDDFTKQYYYHNWCEIIDFIIMECCKKDGAIDDSTVSVGNKRFAKSFKTRHIDIFYLNSIVDILLKFNNNNKEFISHEIDYSHYMENLKIITKTVQTNLK